MTIQQSTPLRSPHRLFLVPFILLLTLVLFLAPVDRASAQNISKQKLKGKKISFLISWTQLGAAEALAKWFKAETGATVQLIMSDYQDLLQATIEDNRSPQPQVDVMMMWYVNLGKLVDEKVVSNLDHFYEQNRSTLQANDYIPGMFDAYTRYKAKRWAVPFDGDSHILFYRKSILEKHGLSPPATWKEYTDIVKLLTEKERDNGLYGTAIMAHPTPILIVSSFMNRLGGYGGGLMDDTMSPTINSKEAILALEAMVEQSKYALPTPLETDFSVSRDAFLLGQVAMVEQWTDIGIMAEDSNQSLIRGDWGAVPMPMGTGEKGRRASSLNAGWTLGLSSKAPNREVAEEFLLFIARPDITLQLNLIPGGGGIDPTRTSVIHHSEFKNIAPVISKVEADILQGDLIVWPNIPEVPSLLKALSDAIVSALENRQSPKEALDSCQKKWLDIVDKKEP